MPRFYFDVRHDGQIVADVEGEVLPDPDAAEREAALAAIHIAKDLLSGARGNLTIEVRDEHGQPVVQAKVSLDIERS
jgi:hypothetical protein